MDLRATLRGLNEGNCFILKKITILVDAFHLVIFLIRLYHHFFLRVCIITAFWGNLNLGLGLGFNSICRPSASEVRRLPMGISTDVPAEDRSSSWSLAKSLHWYPLIFTTPSLPTWAGILTHSRLVSQKATRAARQVSLCGWAVNRHLAMTCVKYISTKKKQTYPTLYKRIYKSCMFSCLCTLEEIIIIASQLFWVVADWFINLHKR